MKGYRDIAWNSTKAKKGAKKEAPTDERGSKGASRSALVSQRSLPKDAEQICRPREQNHTVGC